jgi:DNA-binding Xre family transcriptional regulator
MKKITLEQLGLAAKDQRGGRGIREIANEVGISAATLSRIESGKQPDLDTFTKLCKWLNLNPGEVLGYTEQATNTPVQGFQTVSVHYRADRTLQPETAKRLGELILAVHSALERESAMI